MAFIDDVEESLIEYEDELRREYGEIDSVFDPDEQTDRQLEYDLIDSYNVDWDENDDLILGPSVEYGWDDYTMEDYNE